MNYPEILEQLQKYYSNLLIIQYNGKPKAKATIELMARLALSNMALLQIRDGFDWRNASLAQLEIIGKWVGVSRSYNANNTWNNTYLSYPAYGEESSALTDAQMGGYSDYSDFDTLPGGVLTYNDLQSNSQMLSVEDYRTVIGLKIIKNSIVHNQGNIDKAIALYFAEKDENGNVKFGVFDSSNFTEVGTPGPSITSDGIASGFDSSNYLYNTTALDFSKPFKIVFNEKRGTAPKFNGFMVGRSGGLAYPLLSVQSQHTTNISLVMYINGNYTFVPKTFNHADYTDINYIVSWSGETYTLEIQNAITNEIIIDIPYESSEPLKRTNTSFGHILYGYNPNVMEAIQSTDLKLTSAIIDGQLKLSGIDNRYITNPIVYTTWQPHEITYHYPASLSTIMNICKYKGVLPAPTGCAIQLSSY